MTELTKSQIELIAERAAELYIATKLDSSTSANVSVKHISGGPLMVWLPADVGTLVRRAARATGVAPSSVVIDVLRDALHSSQLDGG